MCNSMSGSFKFQRWLKFLFRFLFFKQPKRMQKWIDQHFSLKNWWRPPIFSTVKNSTDREKDRELPFRTLWWVDAGRLHRCYQSCDFSRIHLNLVALLFVQTIGPAAVAKIFSNWVRSWNAAPIIMYHLPAGMLISVIKKKTNGNQSFFQPAHDRAIDSI